MPVCTFQSMRHDSGFYKTTTLRLEIKNSVILSLYAKPILRLVRFVGLGSSDKRENIFSVSAGSDNLYRAY